MTRTINNSIFKQDWQGLGFLVQPTGATSDLAAITGDLDGGYVLRGKQVLGKTGVLVKFKGGQG